MNRYALVRVFAAMAASAFLMSAAAGPAAADDNGSLTFSRGVGVDPITCPAMPAVCAGVGTVVLNVVRGQQPGGQIWTINKLQATVNTNGKVQVSGKGLVLAGGNNAGGIPTGLKVFATLSCLSTGTFALSSTSLTGVAVSPIGDFQINDTLSSPPPAACPNPLLLIQSATNNHWFALGIVGSGNSND
jgi:hypothetical protein